VWCACGELSVVGVFLFRDYWAGTFSCLIRGREPQALQRRDNFHKRALLLALACAWPDGTDAAGWSSMDTERRGEDTHTLPPLPSTLTHPHKLQSVPQHPDAT
jgi:hypothetical protein